MVEPACPNLMYGNEGDRSTEWQQPNLLAAELRAALRPAR